MPHALRALSFTLLLTACGSGQKTPPGPQPDVTSPTVTLNGQGSVHGEFRFRAEARDDVALRDVRFFDNGLLIATDPSAPYETTRTYTSAENGPHTIKAVATDRSGNSAEASETFTVQVQPPPRPDTTKPTVTMVAQGRPDGRFTFVAQASDDVGIRDVRFFDNEVLIATDAAAPYEVTPGYTPQDDGAHTVRGVATDTSGNTAEAMVTVMLQLTPRPTSFHTVTTAMTGHTGALTTASPTVKVLDQFERPMADVPVSWGTERSQGWVFPRTSTTDVQGLAQADWILGDAPQQALTARVAGLPDVTWTGTAAPLATQANSVHLNFKTPDAKAYRISVQPVKAVRDTYFAAATIQDAYFGLQRHGDGNGGILIFSVWDTTGPATVIRPGDGTYCLDFGNEGTGKSCRLPLQWSLGERFTFEVTVTPVGNDADLTVIVTRGTGQRIDLGTIRHSGAVKLDHAYSFAEDYGPASASCLTTGERLTRISPLQALVNGQWQTFKTGRFTSYYPRTRCGNIYFGNQDGDFLLGTGGRLVSDPNIQQLTLP